MLQRFPDVSLKDKTLKELMGMEGFRMRELYEEKAALYQVGWKGRRYVPGKMELSDTANRIMTSCNAALYGIVCSAIHSMGFSPHIGFVHSGSPLPFVYDVADLYKEQTSVDLAFFLTRELAGTYDKVVVAEAFKTRVLEIGLLKRLGEDIPKLLGVRHVSSDSE